jgi:ribosomal protein S28E/S33
MQPLLWGLGGWPIPLGNEGGKVVCVSVRMRRSMWRDEARLRMRLVFGPARVCGAL